MRSPTVFLTLTILLITSTASAQKAVNFGTTNHFISSYGTADGLNTNGSWYLPALNIRPPVAHYHLEPKEVVSQMGALRASGQNAYTVFIAHSDIGACEATTCYDGVLDGVWGEVIDSGESAMRPQHRENLKLIIRHALKSGFSRIYVRFGYYGNPAGWAVWNEGEYSKAWNFIVDARNAAREEVVAQGLANKLQHPESILMFDLYAEAAGIVGGQMQPFVKRLWQDYTFSFGVDDTVGFSFAWAPGRFPIQRNLYLETGVMPRHWAFDIYEGVDAALASVYSEMGSFRNQPIHLMESYFNEPSVANGLTVALAQNEFLNIQSVGQWPVLRGFNHGHFSRAAVDALSTSSTFTNYLPIIAARKMFFSSTDANILGVRDVSCGTTTGWPCSIRLKWTSPPPGKVYGIYVRTTGGLGLVHCVTSASEADITWISLYPYYVFEVHEILGWCNHPNPNPGAQLVASVEATPFGY